MKTNLEQLQQHDVLQCPACQGSLSVTEDSLTCSGCGKQYPAPGDMPILFPDPNGFIEYWRAEFQRFGMRQQQNIQALRQRLQMPDIFPPQRDRLTRVAEVRAENVERIGEIMRPLLTSFPTGAVPPEPGSLGGYSNQAYLFKDWGWDTDENSIGCEVITGLFPEGFEMRSLLALGAGAARLPWDIHQKMDCPFTLALDTNPMISYGGMRVMRGETLSLHQIQFNNIRNAQDNVATYELRSPAETRNDFCSVLADGKALPIKPESFQVALTPFIIDAINQDLRVFARSVRQGIEPGGYWVNYGALEFQFQFSYTAEEVIQIVNASGFEVLEQGFREVRHMAIPESMQSQHYDTFYFIARKL